MVPDLHIDLYNASGQEWALLAEKIRLPDAGTPSPAVASSLVVDCSGLAYDGCSNLSQFRQSDCELNGVLSKPHHGSSCKTASSTVVK
jgi:hypothetical protein